MPGMRRLITIMLLTLPAAGCNKAPPAAPAAPVSTPVMCVECKNKTTMDLNRYLDQESWPKACPSCRKAAVYPYVICVSCAEAMPLRDPSTGRFGYPARCPLCKKKWEH